MNIFRFLFNDIKYRKSGYVVNLVVVLFAVAIVSYIVQTSKASKRSIQLITKSMGQNIIIIHEQTKLEDYYTATGKEKLFPESYVDSIINIPHILTTYHIAILQKRQNIQGLDIIITGAKTYKGARETAKRKNPFVNVKQDHIRIGSQVSKELNLLQNNHLTISGKKFKISRIEHEKGTIDDYRIYIDLDQYQKLTNINNKINAIIALECLCSGEPISVTEKRIRKQINSILPDTKILTLRNIALARYEARQVTDKYNKLILMLVLIGTLIFIGLQSYSETIKKEKEYALMSAMGFGYNININLFILKSFVISLIASIFGLILGQIFAVKTGYIFAKAKVIYDFSYIWAAFLFSFIIIFFGHIPSLIRIYFSDTFEILREE